MPDDDPEREESAPPRPPADTPPPPRFARFVVETETMADGRRIHYYRWPDDAEQPAPDGSDG